VRIFRRDSKFQPLGTIEAEKAKWDPKAGGWRLTGGVRLPPLKEPALMEHLPDGPEGDPVDFYSTNVGPPEIQRHRASDFYRYMAYGELRALADDPMRSNRQALQVTLHQHITGPIMNLLLLLLGLPFVAGRDDRNYFTNIGVAIALAIGVFALNFACTALGNSGNLSPLLAAWLPVFILLPTSIISMESLRT
jgi:lipopolysaccharide export system permease protein